MKPIVELKNVFKTFTVGEQKIPVLKNISLVVNECDFTIIYGPSGCGKSTLLYTILGLEEPTSGEVNFLGSNLYLDNVDEDERTQFRRCHVGMVYQQSNWVKSLSVIENVALPLQLLGVGKEESFSRAYKMLSKVHMEEWANYSPLELSSGQQQKVAVARAIVTNPEVIIADEPTGNLDYESGRALLHLLGDLRFMGKTIVMVTHDLEYLQYAKKTIKMCDGEIVEILEEKDKDSWVNEVPLKKQVKKNFTAKEDKK